MLLNYNILCLIEKYTKDLYTKGYKIDLEALVNRINAKLCYADFDNNRAVCALEVHKNYFVANKPVILVNKKLSATEQLYLIARCVAYYLSYIAKSHAFPSLKKGPIISIGQLIPQNDSLLEKEATLITHAILLPECNIKRYIEDSGGCQNINLTAMAYEFAVPTNALIHRLCLLNYLPVY